MELSARQQKAVKTIYGPVLLLAGAGTGKTTVLTKRVEEIIKNTHQPEKILALTFTNKATNEMIERLGEVFNPNENFPTISTFHSFCVKMMRKSPNFLPFGFTGNFSIILPSQSKKILKEINDNLTSNEVFELSGMKEKISFWKNKSLKERNEKMPKELKKIISLYQKKLIANDSMDFDDLLNVFNSMLDNDDFASLIQSMFDFILVDEFQDTNKVQYEILSKAINYDQNVFVVGDPDQSIYKFRGAEYENTQLFKEDFSPEIINLQQNYRSTQKILDSSYSLIENNEKRFTSEKLIGSKSSLNDVEKIRFENDFQEAQFICDRIKRGVKAGKKPSSYAILLRNNYQSGIFEKYLTESGVEYQIEGDINFFQRIEIQSLLSILMYLTNTENEYFFKDLTLSVKNGIGEKTLEKISDFLSNKKNITTPIHKVIKDNLKEFHFKSRPNIEDFMNKLENAYVLFANAKNFEDLISDLMEEFKVLEKLSTIDDFEERLGNIETFLTIGTRSIGELNKSNVKTFLDKISLSFEENNDKKEVVTISTIHKAKGLEYEEVFIPFLIESIFPNPERNPQKEDIEEERRIFYVAMTRAKKNLILTTSKNLYKNSENVPQETSRFFEEVS